MSEAQEAVVKPSLLTQVLRLLWWDASTGLVERFTCEMTQVAEGLCEDQARLRAEVETLSAQRQRERDEFEQAAAALEERLKAQEETLVQLSRRIELAARRRRRSIWELLGRARFPGVGSAALLAAAAVLAMIIRLLG